MSTRCQIGVYHNNDSLETPDTLLYKHCDGYPEEILPMLVLGVSRFRNDAPETIGLELCEEFHGDIDYYYAVRPDRIDVYSTGRDEPSGLWKLIDSIEA